MRQKDDDDGLTPLERARKWLVKRYRAHPSSWPDGIDSKWDRWYKPEEWTDEGEHLKPVDKQQSKPVDTVDNVVSVDTAEQRKAYQRDWARRKRAQQPESGVAAESPTPEPNE